MSAPVGAWSTGCCGCFDDCGICCMTFWCPCVQIGRNISMISENRTECLTAGSIWFLIEAIVGCGCLYTFSYRKQLREKFGLPAEPCGDFLMHCCCGSCAVCQEARELKNRGFDPALGYEAVSAKAAPPHQEMK